MSFNFLPHVSEASWRNLLLKKIYTHAELLDGQVDKVNETLKE
jgi:hypothetical protein